MNTITSQKGVSLYLALLIITITLAIGLGLSTLSLLQVQAVRGSTDSVSAFFAVDTGIERELYERNPIGTVSYTGAFEGRSYTVKILGPGQESCPLTVSRCIISGGVFQGARRAIRVTR